MAMVTVNTMGIGIDDMELEVMRLDAIGLDP